MSRFDVQILSDHVKRIGEYYYTLPNYSNYQIRLINNGDTRADAYVSIDGEKIGIWRVNAYSSIVIERPANLNRKLVFSKEYDTTDKKLGIQIINPASGTVSVTFKPEAYTITPYIESPTVLPRWKYGRIPSKSLKQSLKQPIDNKYQQYQHSAGDYTNDLTYYKKSYDFVTGATFLGAGSDQLFRNTARIYEYDPTSIKTIRVKMFVRNTKQDMTEKDVIADENLVYAEIPIYNNLTDRYYDCTGAIIEKPYFT